MDRRSWLWRRKSSEKSPGGETESSGSGSSLSERFSDDQNLSNHNIPSPDDEVNERVKTLSEKLSAALVNIRAKEDLVKQHAKVAEEAVSGWEKTENEVLILKKQNDALTEKKSILEERVGQLDGALKECLRQLRQTREDQEERIHGAIASRSSEWESNKSQLESQLSELHNQLRNAESDANVLADKLEGAERENSSLKLQLLSKDEELELRTRERELCTHAAETASKHHLHSMKKVAQLEAECRRLKALIQKAANTDDHQSVTTSSVYVESFTDSQSDHGDRVLFMENDTCRMSLLESIDNASVLRNGFELSKVERTLGRSPTVTSVGIDLLDDFVEMERLAAALPEVHSGSIPVSRINGEERLLGDELDAVIKRATELEDSLNKITSEKLSLEINLDDYKIKLMESEKQLQQTEVTLVDLKAQLVLADEAKRDAQQQAELWNIKLKNLTKLLDEAEGKLTEVEDKLSEVNESKCALELQVEDGNLKKLESESKIKALELELTTLHSSIWTFEKEKNHSREAVVKYEILEAEISRMKSSSHLQRSAIIEELRINKDEEMAIAARNFAECQKTIASLGCQLKSLAAFEEFWIESETPVAVI